MSEDEKKRGFERNPYSDNQKPIERSGMPENGGASMNGLHGDEFSKTLLTNIMFKDDLVMHICSVLHLSYKNAVEKLQENDCIEVFTSYAFFYKYS